MRVPTTLTFYPPHWTGLDRAWWKEEHFGSDVVGAIDRAYRFVGRVGYYLNKPRDEALAP